VILLLQIAICDDDPVSISSLKELISSLLQPDEYELNTFHDSKTLLSLLEKGSYSPDILVQDIVLNDINGIDIAKTTAQLVPHCQIIFISNYDDYISDVYEVKHTYFIRKRELPKYFTTAIQNCIHSFSNGQTITFRSDGVIVRLNVDLIFYLERDLRRTHIYCSDRMYTCYMKPQVMVSSLKASPFLRCHQSFWVNMDKISSFREDFFTLDNGALVPISRSRKQESRSVWFSFLHHQTFYGKQSH